MDQNPQDAPQTQPTNHGRLSRLLRNPAFWTIAVLFLLLTLMNLAFFLAGQAIDDWYREKGLYVEGP